MTLSLLLWQHSFNEVIDKNERYESEDKVNMRLIKKVSFIGIMFIFSLMLSPLEFIRDIWRGLFLPLESKSGIGFVSEVFAEVFYDAQEALEILLPEVKEIKEETRVLTPEQKKIVEEKAEVKLDPTLDKEFNFYIGESDGQILGYVINDTVKGKWGPIHYMLALEPDGKIKDALVLELKERRGRPVKERRFLEQYFGKTITDPIKLNKDIRQISGATISSRGMTNGIRKLVYVFNELYKK